MFYPKFCLAQKKKGRKLNEKCPKRKKQNFHAYLSFCWQKNHQTKLDFSFCQNLYFVFCLFGWGKKTLVCSIVQVWDFWFKNVIKRKPKKRKQRFPINFLLYLKAYPRKKSTSWPGPSSIRAPNGQDYVLYQNNQQKKHFFCCLVFSRKNSETKFDTIFFCQPLFILFCWVLWGSWINFDCSFWKFYDFLYSSDPYFLISCYFFY